MSLSEKEEERLRESAWRKKAKGRTIRWRMLRDGVAVLSLQWMTTSQFQIAMRRIWGLKNKTSRDMLEELESEKSLTQEQDEKTKFFKWGATPEGVVYWIKNTSAIPAGIVQAAYSSTYVDAFEA